MNAVCFIPARGGSVGVPRKNVKLLAGKPLITYSIEQSLDCGLRTIVSTEDAEIKSVSIAAGAEVLDRPVELAGNHVSMYEVLKSEIPKIEPAPEIIVLVSPTSPMRKSKDISDALSALYGSINDFDSLVTVEAVPGHYNPAQVIVAAPGGTRMADGRRLAERITNRQHYPKAYVTNSGVYVFKVSNLADGSFWGERTMVLACESNIDINTLEDFEECERRMNV